MMGLPALFCGLLFQATRGTTLAATTFAGALAGALGTVLAALILAAMLYGGGEDFLGVAKLALAAHIPVIIIESAISACTVTFLFRVRPELLAAGRRRPRTAGHTLPPSRG